MASKLKVLQVIPKLGYGGAETGCYDIAHYLHENNCTSFIITSGGKLIKFVDKKKVKLIRLPVQSKNPIIIPSIKDPDIFTIKVPSKFEFNLDIANKFIAYLDIDPNAPPEATNNH